MRTRTTVAAAALAAGGALLGGRAVRTVVHQKRLLSIVRARPSFTSAQLAERTKYRRAVEAVIWGMPAVNYDLMLQASIMAGAGYNPDRLLVAPVRLEEPDADPQPGHHLSHALLRLDERADGAGDPAGRW